MPGELTEIRAVSMYPSDWTIVTDADTGDAGVSATLRRIVREWHNWYRAAPPRRADRLVDPPAEYIVDTRQIDAEGTVEP